MINAPRLSAFDMLELAELLGKFHRENHRKLGNSKNSEAKLIKSLQCRRYKYYALLTIYRWPLTVKSYIRANISKFTATNLLALTRRQWKNSRQLLAAAKLLVEGTKKGRHKTISAYKHPSDIRKNTIGKIHQMTIGEIKEKLKSNPAIMNESEPSLGELMQFEDELREYVHSRVKIARGKIEIDYFDRDSLIAIMETLIYREKQADPLDQLKQREKMTLEEIMGDGWTI